MNKTNWIAVGLLTALTTIGVGCSSNEGATDDEDYLSTTQAASAFTPIAQVSGIPNFLTWVRKKSNGATIGGPFYFNQQTALGISGPQYIARVIGTTTVAKEEIETPTSTAGTGSGSGTVGSGTGTGTGSGTNVGTQAYYYGGGTVYKVSYSTTYQMYYWGW